jgi:hypothetical protein
MYSPEAEQRRRCLARTPTGAQCRSWAVWGAAEQRCYAHGGRREAGTPRPMCDCGAYRWGHRPGSGLCRWPAPPLFCWPTPLGTRRTRHRWRRPRPR